MAMRVAVGATEFFDSSMATVSALAPDCDVPDG
jgi:hypothetical protein